MTWLEETLRQVEEARKADGLPPLPEKPELTETEKHDLHELGLCVDC